MPRIAEDGADAKRTGWEARAGGMLIGGVGSRRDRAGSRPAELAGMEAGRGALPLPGSQAANRQTTALHGVRGAGADRGAGVEGWLVEASCAGLLCRVGGAAATAV